MISIIITSYKEPNTIGKAISSIAENDFEEDYEIIAGAPDKETLSVALKLRKKYKKLRVIKDAGKGKPAALNLLVKKSKGDVLILTDGDVYANKDSLILLMKYFKDEKVGAVSGRPISLNDKNNKFGFWSYMLTEIANEIRIKAEKNNKTFFCSGYLFAIRKKLFPFLPEELLSEDGYISNNVYKNRYKIAYSSRSFVYVKYPDNFKDWIKQKKRSAGGYNQIKKMTGMELRSFKLESLGFLNFFKFVKNFKELYWLVDLFFSRIYLWLLIYKDVNLKKKSREEIWQRVLSTK